MAFGNMGTIWSEIGLNTAKLQAGVSTAKLQLSALDRTAMTQAAKVNAKLQTIGTGLQSVGKKMSMFVTLPILAVGAAAAKAGSDFEDGMTKSLAIMNNVSPQIRSQMEQTAKSIVDYTTFSAKEGADAYFYLASAGLDAAQSMEALPRVAKFAQAGNFDLATATDLLTDAQSALGLTIRDDVIKNMENMTYVSDVLVKANALSNATVQQFSESLTNMGATALVQVNKGIEEGVAILSVWADKGIKGAAAGQSLDIVLRDLQKAARENKDLFEEMGINVFDSTGEMLNMADIVEDLDEALAGMSTEQRGATLAALGFQERSVKYVKTLLGTSEAIRGYESDLKSAAGFTADVAAKQMESFTASVEQLKNELINIGIEIFDILKPRLEGLIESIKKGIKWFDSLTESQKKWIVNLGIAAAAIGPVLYGLGTMIKTYGILRTAVITANIATKGFLGTLGFVVGAGAAIAGITYGFEKLTDKIENRFLKVLANSVMPLTGMIDGMKSWLYIQQAVIDGIITQSEAAHQNAFTMDEEVQKIKELREEQEELVRFTMDATKAQGVWDEGIKKSTTELDTQNKSLESAQAFVENYSDSLPIASTSMDNLIQKWQDGTLSSDAFVIGINDIRKATQNGRVDIEDLSEAIGGLECDFDVLTKIKLREFTKAQEGIKPSIESTTEAIEKQREETDKARSAFNELTDDIFGHITTYNDFQEAGWAVEEAEKALTAAIKEHGEESVVAMQAENNLDDAKIAAIQTSFELSTEINATTEEQEEARKKAVELGLEYVNTEQIGAKAFLDMAKEFGMSAADIIDFAKEMGIDIDYATRARLIAVEFNQEHVNEGVQNIQRAIDELHGKTVTLETIYKTSRILGLGAMGGIVGFAGGGVIGNDGATQPLLTAASGIITPQTGRAIPIMAHENEIIANTSQQKNLAEWIMGKANSSPNNNSNQSQPLQIQNIIELDGEIIYKKTSEYLYDSQKSKLSGMGIK